MNFLFHSSIIFGAEYFIYHDFILEEKVNDITFYCDLINQKHKAAKVQFILRDKNKILKTIEFSPSENDSLLKTKVTIKDDYSFPLMYTFKVTDKNLKNIGDKASFVFKAYNKGIIPLLQSPKLISKGKPFSNPKPFRLILMHDSRLDQSKPNIHDLQKAITNLMRFDPIIYKHSELFEFYYSNRIASANPQIIDHKVDKSISKLADPKISGYYSGICILHEVDFLKEEIKGFNTDYYNMKTNIFSSSLRNPISFVHEAMHILYHLSDEYVYKRRPNKNRYIFDDPCYSNMFPSKRDAQGYLDEYNEGVLKHVMANEKGDWYRVCQDNCVMHDSYHDNVILGLACKRRLRSKSEMLNNL